MKITEETKVKDLIPKKYKLKYKEQTNDWYVVGNVLNIRMEVALKS